MAEAKLTIDAVTQAQRDDLRGWNDPPPSLGSVEGLKKPKSRHYSSSSNTSTSSKVPPTAGVSPAPPIQGPISTLMGTLEIKSQNDTSTPVIEKAFEQPVCPCALEAAGWIALCLLHSFQVTVVYVTVQDLAARISAILAQLENDASTTSKLIADMRKRLSGLVTKLENNELSSEAALYLSQLVVSVEQNSRATAAEAQRNLTMKHSHEIGNSSIALNKLIQRTTK
eukprot:TRINITY_DN9050_c0_g2_i2.p1 TRINITY_DN9050_c0_g2~~TRINITY_DN9050_c0_g2_i2.p1  ORF type:complete len:226 (+),score=28.32 TRINITY_DN9050_c0_g2_i2:45-722(+)